MTHTSCLSSSRFIRVRSCPPRRRNRSRTCAGNGGRQRRREARRVLKPGGRFLFNVGDRIEENDFARVVTDAVATIFPNDPPRFLARTPHSYHDVEQIDAELRTAGLLAIEIVTLQDRSAARTAHDPAIAYCQGTLLRNEIEARDPSALENVTARVEAAIGKTFGEGQCAERSRVTSSLPEPSEFDGARLRT